MLMENCSSLATCCATFPGKYFYKECLMKKFIPLVITGYPLCYFRQWTWWVERDIFIIRTTIILALHFCNFRLRSLKHFTNTNYFFHCMRRWEIDYYVKVLTKCRPNLFCFGSVWFFLLFRFFLLFWWV